MQSTNWAPEHSDALREYLAKGMSYSEIADAINAKFKTAYSRNAAIGRAKRMGLAGPDRPKDLPEHWPKRPPKTEQLRLHKLSERHAAEFMRAMPVFEIAQTVKLRCVSIVPRHLRCSISKPAIAATPTAATRRAKPSPSAVTPAERAQAIARRIFT
jgi:GcrA cell cycle regulator